MAAIIAAAALFIKNWEIKLPQALPPSPRPLRDSLIGWQEVANQEYGYKLKIPHDWSAVRLAGEPAYPRRLQVINVKPDELAKPHVGIMVTVYPWKEKPTADWPEIIELADQGKEARKLTLAGAEALFFDNLGESGEEFSIFIHRQSQLYRFDWSGTHPDVRRQYQDVGLKIIASLEFF